MATEYKLSYTASEIDRKLGKVDTLVSSVNGVSPDANGNVELEVSSNIVIDPTLTVEGSAADAKATGDRFLGVEYQTVTTEEAYEHKDLPEGEKTVIINSNGSWGDTAYVCTGEDLIPRKTFNKTFPLNGITITRTDKTYHIEGTPTAKAVINFGQTASDINIEFDEDISGKKYKLITCSNQIIGNFLRAGVRFHAADGSTVQVLNKYGNLVNQIVLNVGNTSLTSEIDFTIPDGVNIAYMRPYLEVLTGATFDSDFRFFMAEDENIYEVTDGTATIDKTDVTELFSLPYPSNVDIKSPIAEYIRYMSENSKGDTATYLMPESFGAVGDGYADDSVAIALCLAMAAETKQTVLMAKKYLVTSPVDISNDGLNIIANDIVYNGSDVAIKIRGQKNTIQIHSITSNGIGISFRGDKNKGVVYNNINIGSVVASSHGIVFYNGLKGIYQNTIKFNLIRAGGSSFYGICELDIEGDSFVTENNFYGGQIANCDWAVYGIGGNSKLYGVQTEDNVQGGFNITKGQITIFHPRIAETQRDGTLPIYKFTEAKNTTIYDSSGIYINQIDLSEMPDSFTAESGVEFPMFEKNIGIINGKILCSNIEDKRNENTSNIYTNTAYIWGKHLIMTPFMAYRKVVTTETLDTRAIGTETTDAEIRALPQLPTKFVVDNVSSDIYLHPSYCAFGFNKFEVEQANGFTCKVYAFVKAKNAEGVYEDSTLLIFDGAEHGDGLYKFEAYKDSAKTFEDYGALWIDRSNQYWSVEKVMTNSTLIKKRFLEMGTGCDILAGYDSDDMVGIMHPVEDGEGNSTSPLGENAAIVDVGIVCSDGREIRTSQFQKSDNFDSNAAYNVFAMPQMDEDFFGFVCFRVVKQNFTENQLYNKLISDMDYSGINIYYLGGN